MTAGVWTVAPFHDSLGDVATQEVTFHTLARAGIPVEVVLDDPRRYNPLVIGGGEIIGSRSRSRWKVVKDRFAMDGAHILNAVGASPAAMDSVDWRFLREYRLVTVRDEPLATAVRSVRKDVEPVPCPATLIPTVPWEFLTEFPGFTHLQDLSPQGYVALHQHPLFVPAAKLLRRKNIPIVLLDVQAHAAHTWRGRERAAPGRHSPVVAASIIANARSVITRSLHMAVFAIAAGTPVTVLDSEDLQSEKVRRYLHRAGCEDAMSPTARDAVARALSGDVGTSDCGPSERRLAEEHLENLVSAVQEQI